MIDDLLRLKKVVDGIITLTITDQNGNITTISLPVGNFTF